MIEFLCSNCREKILVPDKYSGKLIRCAKCKQPTKVTKAEQGPTQAESSIIKFRCGNCNQKIGLPAHYAGKLVKCAKCEQPIRVPETQPQPTQHESAKIAFACSHCNGQFRVPDRFAGKRVKCPNCDEPVRVPELQQEPSQEEPAPAAGAETGDMFGTGVSTDDLLAMEAGAPPVEDKLRLQPLADGPVQEQALPSELGALSAIGPPGGAAVAGGVGINSTPLALVVSFGAALLGALLWAVITCVSGYELGLVAWGVGVSAGAGLTLFTHDRSVKLGLLAAFFAFLGIMMGKVFIAKWYILPQMKKAVHRMNPSNEQIAAILENPEMMFAVACLELADRREFDQDFAWQVIASHNSGQLPAENKEEIESAQKKALELLDSWPEARKRMAARRQASKIARKVTDYVVKGKIGLFIAFIGAFSLWDLLWFGIALVSAYKIGAGLTASRD
jgi:hypothetical protein